MKLEEERILLIAVYSWLKAYNYSAQSLADIFLAANKYSSAQLASDRRVLEILLQLFVTRSCQYI